MKKTPNFVIALPPVSFSLPWKVDFFSIPARNPIGQFRRIPYFCNRNAESLCMGKLKDIWNGEHRSFVRYAVAVTAVFIVLVGFVNQDNIVRWVKADIELKQQRRQIERYRQEIDEMDRKIQMISNDKDTLERFAREHFGFTKDGDDVYVIEKK